MSDHDLVSLHLPSGSSFNDLPRTGLAALLRIHRIDPGGLGDLAVSVHQTAAEMLGSGDDIKIDYRVTDTEVQVELHGRGRTARLSAPRGGKT